MGLNIGFLTTYKRMETSGIGCGLKIGSKDSQKSKKGQLYRHLIRGAPTSTVFEHIGRISSTLVNTKMQKNPNALNSVTGN